MARDVLLSRKETAAYLRIKTATLDVWASRGRGPAFIKLGDARSAKVLYPFAEIKRYLADPVSYRWPAKTRKVRSYRRK